MGEVDCSEPFTSSAAVQGGRELELTKGKVLIEKLELLKLVKEGAKSAKWGISGMDC